MSFKTFIAPHCSPVLMNSKVRFFFIKGLYFPSLVNEAEAGTFLSNPQFSRLQCGGAQRGEGTHWVTPLPSTHVHNIHTHPALSEVALPPGFHELPGTFKEQKKGRRALGLSWQHRGKLANGPGNLNKKNKVVIPQRQLNIQIFFCICTAPYATGARRG